MISFNQISASAYKDARYNLLLAVEELGVPKLPVYADSRGIATIGIGFNLRDNAAARARVFAALRITNPTVMSNIGQIFRRD